MATVESVKAKFLDLISKGNAVTGAADTNLTAVVDRLAEKAQSALLPEIPVCPECGASDYDVTGDNPSEMDVTENQSTRVHYYCKNCDNSWYAQLQGEEINNGQRFKLTEKQTFCVYQASATCEDVGMSVYVVYEPAKGHNHKKEVYPPTCAGPGANIYRCDCGDEYLEFTDAPLPHDYVVTSEIQPTCTTEGEINYACPVCGDAYGTIIPALGHDFVNGVCTRCGATDEVIL